MENPSRFRASQPHSSNSSMKQRRSGYEPSDTETEWQESPWRDHNQKKETEGALDLQRNVSPMKLNRRHSWRFESNGSSPPRGLVVSPARRRHSKSPYKPHRDEGNAVSPKPSADFRRNVSPFSKSERRRHISPYKAGRVDNKNLGSEEKHSQLLEVSRGSEISNYSRRSLSAARSRARERDQQNNHGHTEQRGERTPSPLSRSQIRKQREASTVQAPSVGEINEMVANTKLSRLPVSDALKFESIDSISPGDIFFSRDVTALAFQKDVIPKNGGFESRINPLKTITEIDSSSHQPNRANGSFDQRNSSNTALSRTTMSSNSAISMQSSSKISTESSKMSDASGMTSGTFRKFTANIKKSQTEPWFSCMRKGPCRTSKSPKSPESSTFDEATFIEKAFVVEYLRQFWADKHQPASLNGFTCHKQEAQLLKELVSHEICPHILFKGPSGSGKRALTMAVLREIYGDPSWNISHDLRYFNIQEKRSTKALVPVTSSAHHVELNVNLEQNAKYALMGLVKEISSNYAITPEVSNINFKADYKVIVLYEVDKAAENIQHLIKWIIDCYSDACKLILCCEDDIDILEPIKNRCKVIKVDAPVTHEIMEVLIQIARKEDFDLPMSFAAKIATKSKQNLRKAIMALEACKAHSYPFVDDQPIPLGWEEVLVELAAEILADPSPKRLFFIRGKIQKLLVDFVHPKLILQKLVEQFLQGS
ncbi:hypothetical protein L1049_024272 [Liquidambar formosana]|uniref:Replication factor C subunit 3 n=1 Tax=Liquidambar formosana TaxID=63359 RepID=A0AAP0RV12_LIQFO